MRLAPTLVLAAVLGFAAAASAQPAPDKSPAPAPVADKPKSNPEADAALAIAIRMDKDRQARIAYYACLSGDKSKCTAADGGAADAQAANAPTTPRTPSP
jgi:hypothetical protein